MFFFVDNTTTDKIVFFVSSDGKVWREHVFASLNEGDLEKSFNQVLQTEKIDFDDVSGIAVRVGAGRFTATRLAVTFVNTLALSLQIPVISTISADTAGLLEKIKDSPVGVYASAIYSAEPRIGGVNDK